MKPSSVLCLLTGALVCVGAQLSSTVPPYENTSAPPVTETTPPNASVTSEPSTPMSTTPQPTTTQGPASPSQTMCPPTWTFFQGRCYHFVTDALTWPQALSRCALLGSTLASVHSAQEYAFLQQLAVDSGNLYAWLGGFYLQDQWLWLDGSWFYNVTWNNDNPDSSAACLSLSSYEPWTNFPCDVGTSPSVCVKTTNVPPEMTCPAGWTGFQGRCYSYSSDSLTWPEADASCAALGASLVSVHSPEEYHFLSQQTSSSAWLGGFYLDGGWLWLDGSWFYQEFFSQTSPGDSSQCLSSFGPDGWAGYSCDQALPSFCVIQDLSFLP